MDMLLQYSAKVDLLGTAYSFLEATEKDKKVTIEYYLVFTDGDTPFIKGGVLEVEAVLDQTLETYVKEHVAESLPFMVLRYLVDNREPSALENMADVIFTEDATAIAGIKTIIPNHVALIAAKSNSEAVKAALA
jgi:hypothetical protein